jgi:hypothetical protein
MFCGFHCVAKKYRRMIKVDNELVLAACGDPTTFKERFCVTFGCKEKYCQIIFSR